MMTQVRHFQGIRPAIDGQDSLPSSKICRSLLSEWVRSRTVSQEVPGSSDGFPPFPKLLHQKYSLPASLWLNNTASPAFHIALNPKRTFVVCQLVLNRRRVFLRGCSCLGFYITFAATPSHLRSAPHPGFPARTKPETHFRSLSASARPKTHFRSLLSDNASEH